MDSFSGEAYSPSNYTSNASSNNTAGLAGLTRKLMHYVAGSPSLATVVESTHNEFMEPRRASFADLASHALAKTVHGISGQKKPMDYEAGISEAQLFHSYNSAPIESTIETTKTIETEEARLYNNYYETPTKSFKLKNSTSIPGNTSGELSSGANTRMFYDDGEVSINYRTRFIPPPQPTTGVISNVIVESSSSSNPSLPSNAPHSIRGMKASVSLSEIPNTACSPMPATLEDLQDSATLQDNQMVIPSDWMISFNSPQQVNPKVLATPSNKYSLIDTFSNEYSTPNSILKYSEKDLEKLRAEWKEQIMKECQSRFNDMADKVQSIQKDYDSIILLKEALESKVKEYEDKQQMEQERMEIKISKADEESQRIQGQLNTVESSFAELRVKYEELKNTLNQARKTEEKLNSTIGTLKNDVQISEQRVHRLKDYAEKKLNEANQEIERCKQKHDTETDFLRMKLQKAEMKQKTLESQIQQKLEENSELSKMNDELLKKLEEIK